MNKRVLIVDDDSNILNAHQRNLRFKYEITTANSGEEGLKLIRGNPEPYALVLSDYRMPEMDGIKFLAAVKRASPNTVRIMLTGYADVNAAIATINEGNVFRFLTKPCSNENLVKAINDGIEQHQLITSERELIEKTLRGSIKLLIDILSIVSPIAFSRANRLRTIIKRLGKSYDDTMQWKLEIAALLSQIGCVAIPTEIIEKKNNNITLSHNEKELFFTHPYIGKSLLENIPRLEEIADAITYQYRRYEDKTDSENEKNSPAAIIARLLKHAVDLDILIEAKKKDKDALEAMKTHYDMPEEGMDYEISEFEKNYTETMLTIDLLVPGMILARDVLDRNGLALVGKGQEITEPLIMRLTNFASLKRIPELIGVYIPK